MEKYVVLQKQVGETPLSCAEAWRSAAGVDASIPLAYAGRLDPMASGKLLVLIGDECKNQTSYHNLDKAYDFSILFGIESDTQDVLGRLQTCSESVASGFDQRSGGVRLGLAPRSAPSEGSLEAATSQSTFENELIRICKGLVGTIELPYPKFSAKTVGGKPLHMWTLEGKLDEIEVPMRTSEIYSLEFDHIETLTREQVCDQARAKIDTIPEVTDPRKALGADFRRVDVRADWERIKNDASLPSSYNIAHFSCIASSGTYMRTLARVVAEKLDTCGLAWHIHRTHIGTYDSENKTWNIEF